MSQDQTNKYTKEQLHEAYTLEYLKRTELNEDLNDARRQLKELTFNHQKALQAKDDFIFELQEDYLRLHIEKYIPHGDNPDEPQASLDDYFNSQHHTFYTPTGGYYCLSKREDCFEIAYAWYDPTETRTAKLPMLRLIHEIYDIAKAEGIPVRYTGLTNVLSNHSVELEPDYYQLRFDDFFDDYIEVYKEYIIAAQDELDQQEEEEQDLYEKSLESIKDFKAKKFIQDRLVQQQNQAKEQLKKL